MELPHTVALFLLSLFLLHHHAASTEKRSVYIVHMEKSFMPKAFSTPHYWYSSILKSTKSAPQLTSLEADDKSEPELIYTYDNALHGFSALISEDELEAIKTSPGFLSAYPDDVVTLETTHSPEFLGLNTATGLWPASHYGKDVIIGVFDSGIWPESPSFGDDGMTEIPPGWHGVCQEGEQFNSSLCNNKLIGARYFADGYRRQYPNITITPLSARDVQGHGTHAASIAAGNYVDDVSYSGYAPGRAKGVAPRARLAVYKVQWGSGAPDVPSGVSSDLLAGINQAIADGVHIMTISLSNPNRYLYRNPISIAGFRAREKGILVSVSAGNYGPNARTLRSGVPWVVSVAAGTVDRWFAGRLTLGNGNVITGWSTHGESTAIRNVNLRYNFTLSRCDSAELLAQAPARTIIVCDLRIRNVLFINVMQYLRGSNVRAAIIIAEQSSIYRTAVFPFPGVVISPGEGRDVIRYASTAAPYATIEFQRTILGSEPRAAPVLSETSARGPAAIYDGILKPDIMGPGVLILGATPPRNAGSPPDSKVYSFRSGTSMACPHISGIAALLKAAHPEWSPAAIQSAMMTTANHLDNAGEPIREQDNSDATPLGIGSGMVDPNRALDPGLIYDASTQDLVNLVCSMNLTPEQIRTIIGSDYNCINPSADLNYPSFVALIPSGQSGNITRTFRRTVTNVGDGAAKYTVQIRAPQSTQISIQPQTLEFGAKNEKKSYSLTISYTADVQTSQRSGSITWVDETCKYIVRSPIVVYPASPDN